MSLPNILFSFFRRLSARLTPLPPFASLQTQGFPPPAGRDDAPLLHKELFPAVRRQDNFLPCFPYPLFQFWHSEQQVLPVYGIPESPCPQI